MASLVAALEAASRGIEEARATLAADYSEHKQKLEADVEGLTTKLRDELQAVATLKKRLDEQLEELERALKGVRTERQTWEAQARATDARHDAATQELRAELAVERARVTELETENRRLRVEQGALDERLAALENKKKVFGLF